LAAPSFAIAFVAAGSCEIGEDLGKVCEEVNAGQTRLIGDQ
jgi:hypothetical protein